MWIKDRPSPLAGGHSLKPGGHLRLQRVDIASVSRGPCPAARGIRHLDLLQVLGQRLRMGALDTQEPDPGRGLQICQCQRCRELVQETSECPCSLHGSILQLTPHAHSWIPDGVFYLDAGGELQLHRLVPPPTRTSRPCCAASKPASPGPAPSSTKPLLCQLS